MNTDISESASLLPPETYQRTVNARTPLEVQHGDKFLGEKDTKKWILPSALGLFVCSVLLLWTGSSSPALLGSPEQGFILESFKADFDGSMFGNFEKPLGFTVPGTESTVQKVHGTFWWYSNSTNDLFITSLNVGSTNIYFWENGFWKQEDQSISFELAAIQTTGGSAQCILNSAIGPAESNISPGNFLSSDSSISSMKYDETVEVAGGGKAERWVGLIDDDPALASWMSQVGTEALWLFIRSPSNSAPNRVLPLYHRVTPTESTVDNPMADAYFVDFTFFNYETLSETFETNPNAFRPEQCPPTSGGRRLSPERKALRRKTTEAKLRSGGGCPFKRFFKKHGIA